MMTLLTAALPFAVKGPNPADVKPGWLAFGIFLAMFAAVILLWLSFRKQLKKVNFEEKPARGETAPTDQAPAADEHATNGDKPTQA
ncbi:MAG: heme exporter protein CcmD [Nocardioides sp.]